jgi:7-carboxy-7-deazaguanine synthase
MHKYLVAERFASIQGEGLYSGTPMKFIRFVGCSVGKKICHACDTSFEQILPWRGGGEYTPEELLEWAGEYQHVCLTGGEPLDQDLQPLLAVGQPGKGGPLFHVETSGTKTIQDLPEGKVWVCVSPKPGFLEESIDAADEVKVIVPGLGSGPGWPTLADALGWAAAGKLVYLQPRNAKFDVDQQNLRYVLDLLVDHPQLRLSLQAHKLLKVQ